MFFGCLLGVLTVFILVSLVAKSAFFSNFGCFLGVYWLFLGSLFFAALEFIRSINLKAGFGLRAVGRKNARVILWALLQNRPRNFCKGRLAFHKL